MSIKQIIIDDHAGTPIDDAQTAATQARILIAREGTSEVIEWDALNLTDESWDELVKTLREFCPDAEPNMSGEAHAAHVRARDAACGICDATGRHEDWCEMSDTATTVAEAAAKVPAAAAAPAAKVPAAKVPAQRLSQGEARKRSQAVRAWWQSLSPQALKALGLPEAKAGPGRMPPAVTDAYNAAHA